MVDSVWLLRVNADGSQDMAYENGDKPVDAPTPPGPVQDLSATANGSYNINLDWSAVTGADEYLIQRSPDNLAWNDITTTAATEYNSGGLQADTPYYYRVFALNEYGASSASNTATARTAAASGGETDLSKLYWTADWSDKADGASLNGSAGEAYGLSQCAYAKVSSVRSLNGRKSARETVGPSNVDGDGGIEYMGFIHWINENVIPYGEEGSEAWFRIWFYNEPGYVYDTDTGHRKTIRYAEQTDDGSYGGGYGDFKTAAPYDVYSAGVDTMTYNRESYSGYRAFDPNDTQVITSGRWICMEAYTKQGRSESSGEVRMWMDGVPMRTYNTTTMHSVRGRLSRILYINYWNKGIPKNVTQSWCAPAIAVRNSRRNDVGSMAVDANGFPFIGLAT